MDIPFLLANPFGPLTQPFPPPNEIFDWSSVEVVFNHEPNHPFDTFSVYHYLDFQSPVLQLKAAIANHAGIDIAELVLYSEGGRVMNNATNVCVYQFDPLSIVFASLVPPHLQANLPPLDLALDESDDDGDDGGDDDNNEDDLAPSTPDLPRRF